MNVSAVIIDTRGSDAFVYVVNNILDNMPNATVEWFHGPDTDVQKYIGLIKNKASIRLHELEFDPPFTLNTYNRVITSKSFYDKLYENILVFQPDSCIENISLHTLDDFTMFDYIGAPWEEFEHWSWNNSVGNGGFSFRKKTAMLKCIEENPYVNKPFHEDVYFGWDCQHLISVAPVEVARRFAYETSRKYYGSFGFHKVWCYGHSNTATTDELGALQ